MPSAFLSSDARLRDTWKKAFPDLIAGTLARVPDTATLVWVLRPTGTDADILNHLVRNVARQAGGKPLILLADEPNERDAMLALAAGASGYCNGHAAPAVLAQVAQVVENGGVWVGQGLLQRLLAATSQRLAASPTSLAASEAAAWKERLTAREQEVAVLLAQGESNKEIARRMDISERTVKAHVGAMLEKLGVRDRLQLSLVINGLAAPR